jgi:hypothetical protein
MFFGLPGRWLAGWLVGRSQRKEGKLLPGAESDKMKGTRQKVGNCSARMEKRLQRLLLIALTSMAYMFWRFIISVFSAAIKPV